MLPDHLHLDPERRISRMTMNASGYDMARKAAANWKRGTRSTRGLVSNWKMRDVLFDE